MSRLALLGKGAGLIGGVVGLAAGAALGFAAEKAAVGRIRLGGDPEADEPLGSLRGRVVPVHADDGTRLHCEVDGPDDPRLTIVFSHGYALNSDTFHYQRRALRHVLPEDRLVFWDQRSHGRSERGHRDRATIDQLGRDLWKVIEAAAPGNGPLVLVGHSMGGMTLMALADQRPYLFGDRVIGVALITTSAGGLADIDLGIPVLRGGIMRRIKPGIVAALGRQHALVERGRRIGSDVGFLVTKRYSFGSSVSPALVEFVAEMNAATPIDVLAEFYPSLSAHEKRHALAVLNNGVEVLVVGARGDQLIPLGHSEHIRQEVHGAEYVEIDDAGHMVMLEHHEQVTEHLLALVERASRHLSGATEVTPRSERSA